MAQMNTTQLTQKSDALAGNDKQATQRASAINTHPLLSRTLVYQWQPSGNFILPYPIVSLVACV